MPAATVKVVFDKTRQVGEGLKILGANRVLVGIPEAKTERDDENVKEPVTNAMIGFWNEKGAPEANLPARPHLVPGVKSVQKLSISLLRDASIAALSGASNQVMVIYNKVGLINITAVKGKLLAGLTPSLSPKTVAARARARGASKRRKSEEKYLELINEGSSAQVAQDATGIKPLINTAQYLRAITYVIRKVR